MPFEVPKMSESSSLPIMGASGHLTHSVVPVVEAVTAVGNISSLPQTHSKSKTVTKRRKKVSKPRTFILDGNMVNNRARGPLPKDALEKLSYNSLSDKYLKQFF